MPIEVELKARVQDADALLRRLRDKSDGQPSTYRDTYYDWPDRRLGNAGRQELRIRVIEADSETKALWTFKGAMLDAASTPEFETMVTEPDMAQAILAQLGLEPVIAYTKHCVNFTFESDHHRVKASVVQVPELEGTFLEIERSTMAGRAHETCGGRSLNDDVIDTLYTFWINGGAGPVIRDGVDAASRAASTTFPYLAEPNPNPPTPPKHL